MPNMGEFAWLEEMDDDSLLTRWKQAQSTIREESLVAEQCQKIYIERMTNAKTG